MIEPNEHRCCAPPNRDTFGLGPCERPPNHRGPHRFGTIGWVDLPGDLGPSLPAPFNWLEKGARP